LNKVSDSFFGKDTQKKLDDFLKEKVEFNDMPHNSLISGYRQQAKLSYEGSEAVKTVTRTLTMNDGKEKVLVKTVKRKF